MNNQQQDGASILLLIFTLPGAISRPAASIPRLVSATGAIWETFQGIQTSIFHSTSLYFVVEVVV